MAPGSVRNACAISRARRDSSLGEFLARSWQGCRAVGSARGYFAGIGVVEKWRWRGTAVSLMVGDSSCPPAHGCASRARTTLGSRAVVVQCPYFFSPGLWLGQWLG